VEKRDVSKAQSTSFCIVPANPRSARIRADVSGWHGIDFAIGEEISDDIFLGSSGEELGRGEEEFFWICEAVFVTHFEATVTYSSKGKSLCSRMTLQMGGRSKKFRRQRIFWWLFPNRTTKHFSYEPYY